MLGFSAGTSLFTGLNSLLCEMSRIKLIQKLIQKFGLVHGRWSMKWSMEGVQGIVHGLGVSVFNSSFSHGCGLLFQFLLMYNKLVVFVSNFYVQS